MPEHPDFDLAPAPPTHTGDTWNDGEAQTVVSSAGDDDEDDDR